SASISHNEILYKGKLFDIKSAVCKNGLIALTVIYDNREQNIISFITGIKNNSRNNSAGHPVKLKSSQPFNCIFPVLNKQTFDFAGDRHYFIKYTVTPTSPFSKLLAPPPEWC
ncbi:MAG TPA: hypothetical protein VFW78_12515, partial [Bacteroidia bacterium]|nr:hypothetical protein [Bacteroidia bacterium]